MHIHFWLGLTIGCLALIPGIAIGVNCGAREQLKEFNEKKYHRIGRIIE